MTKGTFCLSFHCDQCEWKSTHHFNFHRHLLFRHAGKENTVCTYCQKTLSVEAGETGYGFKKFSCAECPQVAPMNRFVKSLQGGEKLAFMNINPNVHCNLFLYRLAFNLHQFRSHGGKEPNIYMCDKCGYKCYKSYNFRRHSCTTRSPEERKQVNLRAPR